MNHRRSAHVFLYYDADPFDSSGPCVTSRVLAAPVLAEEAEQVQLSHSNGAFRPSEVRASADKPVVFRIRNLDAKPMEFESKSLRVKKGVAAKSEGVINVRPLKAGRYEFYDDFNERARGTLNMQ